MKEKKRFNNMDILMSNLAMFTSMWCKKEGIEDLEFRCNECEFVDSGNGICRMKQFALHRGYNISSMAH